MFLCVSFDAHLCDERDRHWGVYSVPSYCQCGDYNVECPQTCYSEWYGHRLRESTVNNPVGAATQAFHAKAYGKNFAYEDFAPMWTNELFNATEWAVVTKACEGQARVSTTQL